MIDDSPRHYPRELDDTHFFKTASTATRQFILRLCDLIGTAFPHLARTPESWKLTFQSGSFIIQAQLTAATTLIATLREGATTVYLSVPSQGVGMMPKAREAVERMALSNDSWTDFIGWISYIKTLSYA